VNAATPAAKAEFSVKNGSTVVEIIEGKDFYIDPASGAALMKEPNN